ncbi:hypothetical protein SPBR_02831 [Sporothrix brasiliensis 5110]|uniref:Rhodopsin domain-containing protein n=1 Tax=Sporothrix brasiliensis 5110 TaxID=1398154 RepID=A0A0C2J0M4_9PEZI|nr:uncharacterized protein SPBR_02831 [Sporothrix brasiliensis 5110]KIH92540.1 hypothetical protein SPBR_02831 [Sporothrix brasiliensis 5110]
MEAFYESFYAAPGSGSRLKRRQAATAIPVADLPHDNQAPQLNFTIWLLTGLSLGFLILRVYCKFLRGRGLWWDDYVLITSWISLALASAFTTAATSFGYGKHLWDIDGDSFYPLNVVATLAGFFSILAAVWSKTSFAMTVLRISTGWMRWAIWFIIMSVNVILGASAIFQWIRCMPVQKIFDASIDGACWPQDVVSTYNTFSTAYSGAMDICLAVFPWKIIWGMSMNRKEKLGVLFAMSMGVFAGAASLIKSPKVMSLSNSDPSNTVQLVIWGVAESAITIIAASIPILRALLRDDKMSNAPHSEAEIELTTSNWNTSSFSSSRLGNNLDVHNINGADSTITNNRNNNRNRNRNNSVFGRIRAAVTRSKTRHDTNTTTTSTSTSAGGMPSWVTAPVTISSANRDRSDDGRPLSTEIATGSKSLV